MSTSTNMAQAGNAATKLTFSVSSLTFNFPTCLPSL